MSSPPHDKGSTGTAAASAEGGPLDADTTEETSSVSERKLPPPPPAAKTARPAALPAACPLPPSAGKLAGKQLAELAGGVVHGARRPDAPASVPPSKDLPALPKPTAGTPTPLPPPPASSADDGLEVDVAAPERAPSEPPRRSSPSGIAPQQLPAICSYGRYEILGRIAFGGMAEIFLGRENLQVGAARMLAIKRILPQVAGEPTFVEMFLDEARLAIQLTHPNICHIYEFGELEGTYFIAMEWVHGAALGKVIRRARDKGGLAPELVAKITMQVAEALHYAHRAKDATGQPLHIVHRDVTPHNVMVSYQGQVKLLDFGIAKATTASTKTEVGVVKGKFAYMSPQQCVGQPVDARSDVFALGVVLYEALTGKSLYQRPTDYETMKAVIEEPVPSVRAVRPELPEALDLIVQKALQKAPDDRWRSAEAMHDALEQWLASTGKTVSTSRLATMMEELFADEVRRGPMLDSTPFGQSFQRRRIAPGEGTPVTGSRPSAGGNADPGDEPGAIPGASSRNLVLGLVAVVSLLGVGIGAWLLGRSGGSSEPPAEPPATVAHVEAPPTPPPTVAVEVPPTPPPTVAAPARGRVIVRPDVPGATIHVGDEVLGAEEAESGLEVAPGHYVVRVEHAERRTFEAEIDVEPGEREELAAHLEPRVVTPARPPGRLSINTRPWSKVYVGSRLLGTTPIAEATVQSGTLRLRIVDRDGRVFSRTITVPANDEASAFYNLDE